MPCPPLIKRCYAIIITIEKGGKNMPRKHFELNSDVNKLIEKYDEINNVDFNKCSISVVRSSKSKPNGKTSTKTRSSVRIIDLGKNVMSVLSKHKAEQDARKGMLGSAYVDNNLVFCQATGKPLCPRAFARSFERALAQHKLRKIRFHDLRHTHATMLLLKGIPIHVVSKRLGHSSIRITLEYYSHVIPGMQEQVVDLINQMTENVESEAIKL